MSLIVICYALKMSYETQSHCQFDVFIIIPYVGASHKPGRTNEYQLRRKQHFYLMKWLKDQDCLKNCDAIGILYWYCMNQGLLNCHHLWAHKCKTFHFSVYTSPLSCGYVKKFNRFEHKTWLRNYWYHLTKQFQSSIF